MIGTSTIDELALLLSRVKTPIKLAALRSGAFSVTVEWARGSASFKHGSLASALGFAISFVQQTRRPGTSIAGTIASIPLTTPEPETAAEPEPEEAPPVRNSGTQVGYALPGQHCFACGYGEEEGQVYSTIGDCPQCGTSGKACPLPPGHEGNHIPVEAA